MGPVPSSSSEETARGRSNSESRPPPSVPDYELIRKIGQGGYGEVWLARGVTGAYRAVKIVWRDRFEDASPYEREFRGVKEAMTFSLETGQLPVLHVGRAEEQGFFYYVMELADDASASGTFDPGRYRPLTLKEMKARAGRLPPARCFELAGQIAQGLAALHARGLVHRDIKPANVIIVKGEPRLADIGLVAVAGDGHTYVGTQGYLPPEGPGAPMADVFALGKLLYELATGFDREEFPRLPADVTDRAERAALFQLNEILLRACDPDPRKRYRDATALLADLRARQQRRQRRGVRVRRVLAAVALVATASALVWWQGRHPGTAAPAAAPALERSIAVLPFANLSDDRENGYFADGVSEDILTDLANLSSLRVIARTTMLQYRQTTKPVRQIGAELSVAYVLEGSVRRAGGKIRLTGQLIRAATEEPVWAKTYDRDLTDVFALQSDLARDIVAALRGVLTTRDETRLAARPTTSIAAYDLYQQARALQYASEDPQAVAPQQRSLLERALQLDPAYAEAWALLSTVRLGEASEAFTQRDPAAVARSEADLRRAEELAPDNYVVLSTRASFAALQRDRATVNRCRQRILELYPNRAEAWYAIGLTALHEHRYRDVIAAFRQALAVDPRNEDILYSLKSCLAEIRWYEDQAKVVRELVILEPRSRSLQLEAALIPLHQHGSTAELRAFVAGLPARVDPADVDLLMVRAQALFALGDAQPFVQLWREAGPAWRFNEARVLDEATVAMALRALHDPTDVRPLLTGARDRARAVLAREPGNIARWNQLGLYLALMGETAEAQQALAHARELLRTAEGPGPSEIRNAVLFYNSIWRAWAGEVEQAIPQMAAALHGPVMTGHSYVEELRHSLLTLPMQGNPAFAAVLADPALNAPILGNGDPTPPAGSP